MWDARAGDITVVLDSLISGRRDGVTLILMCIGNFDSCTEMWGSFAGCTGSIVGKYGEEHLVSWLFGCRNGRRFWFQSCHATIPVRYAIEKR